MREAILHILKLVLRIFSKLIPNAFHKNLEIAVIFAEEDLKFFTGYNNIRVFFLSIPAFILSLASINIILRKRSRKQGAIIFIDSSRIEMIFALLAELIAIQKRFTKIQVREPSFEELFFWLW